MGYDIVVVQFFAQQLYRFERQRVDVHWLVFLLASSKQAEEVFEHFVRTKGGIFYLVKEPFCRRRYRAALDPEIASPQRRVKSCLSEVA